jgi:hypothetical protein
MREEFKLMSTLEVLYRVRKPSQIKTSYVEVSVGLSVGLSVSLSVCLSLI